MCLLSVGLLAGDLAVAAAAEAFAKAEPVQVGPEAEFQRGNPSADPSDLPALSSASPPGEKPPVEGDFSIDPTLPRPKGWTPPPSDGFVEGESEEIASLTTATRQVFENPDGTVTEELSSSPVRFKDEAGGWVDFDGTLVSEGDRLVPAAAPEGPSVAATADSDAVVQAQTTAGVVALGQPDADAVRAKVSGDDVVFKDADDSGADLVVNVLPDGFETTLVVDDASVASFEQVLHLPEGIAARSGGPGVELLDKAGKVVGTYGAGTAVDAAKPRSETVVSSQLVSQAGTEATVSISVDPTWLAADRRVFPVAIDPVFSTTTGSGTALDTYVQSNIINTPQASSVDLKTGVSYGTSDRRRALLRFDLGSLVGPNRQVVSADLNLYNSYSPSCTARPVEIRSLAAPFNANTLWSNQPAYGATTITSPGFAKGYSSSCPGGNQAIDVASLVQKWVDGSSNNGLGIKAVNETDNLAGKTFTSAQSWVPPTLSVTYNRPPTPAALSSPADQATVSTTQPTLAVTPGTDPDGDPLQYWWSVSTSPDVSGQILSSGFLPAGTASWKVPPGSLTDGSTYYWKVFTFDGRAWPGGGTEIRSFTVDTRLGAAGLSPMDQVGPAQVNLTNGNLVISTGSPSFPTVGGNLGVNYTYNSQAEPAGGLTGSYFSTGWGATNHRPPADASPGIVRRDPVMRFDWGTKGPGGSVSGGDFYAKWTGYMSVPVTGGYKIGGSCNGGINFTMGTAVADAWTGCPSGTDTWSATVPLEAGDVVPITAEYWHASGPASVNLRVRGPGLPAPAGIDMPASWLSTTAPALPAGWNVSADLDGAATYRSAIVTTDAVTFTELDGTTHRYPWDETKKAYQPPPDEHGTVGTAADGSVTLIDEGGQTYAFNQDGTLQSVSSALDDTNSAAAQMTWTASSTSPSRLTSIKDPVSDRGITLLYAGDPGCTTMPGFTSAPAGMLCAIDYSDFAGAKTELGYNPGGQLTRILDPGGEVTDFAYDSIGRISKVRDPLAADAVAAGVRADNDSTRTLISYGSGTNKVAAVTLAEPQAGEARPGHSYTYTNATTTDVAAPGLASTTGRLQRVVYDAKGRPTAVTDQAGRVTNTAWDDQDRIIAGWDAATGLKSTTVYDAQGNATDTWGPAPTAWWTSPAAGGAPTAANQANTPHETAVFDGGVNTLAATWWNNNTFTGAPADRATGLAPPLLPISKTWGSGTPAGVTGAFSGRLTGWINLTNTSPVDFRLNLAGTARLYVGNKLVIDAATPPAATATSPFDGTYTPGATGAGWQPITIEYADTGTTFAALGFWSRQGGAAFAPVSTSTLSPGYGLVTSATDTTGTVTTTSYTDTAANLGPEDGLPVATTTDPGGSALVNRTSYEGAGGYRREVSHQLPTGTASTVATSYYGGTEARNVPCSGGDTGVNQGGMTRRVTAADPSGSGNNGLARETVYDRQGRPAATRVVADGANNWSCTVYDARSRPTSVTSPDLAQRSGRTTTNNYAVGANPLVTSVTDTVSGQPARTVTTTVDLLGQVRQYVDAWGSTTVTSHDQVGRVTETQSGVGTETTTYDPAGNEGPTVLDGATLATPHYDSAGRLDWVQYANGTKTDPVTRDALGRETGSTWRNTATNAVISTETSTLDKAGRLTDLTTDGNDPHPGDDYTYDKAGRLTNAWTSTRDAAGAIGSRHSAYGFGTAAGTCAAGTQAQAGKNTNRTSQTIGDGGSAVTTSYCYDAADRLVSTTEPGVGVPTYDSHGNTTMLWGEVRGYDSTDRHSSTIHDGTTVKYTRDGADRIIAREVGNPATETQRYGFTGDGDTPDLVLDGSEAVLERSIGLPGGASVTYRSGSSQVWSLTNLHGDTAVVTDGSGAAQGPQRTYDPFGNATGQAPVDNSAGAFDYGWLGQHQRPTEHESGLAQTIEMGARQYDLVLGRFLEADPVEGGSANDYEYCNGDPVNCRDIDGHAANLPIYVRCSRFSCTGYLTKAFSKTLYRIRNLYRGSRSKAIGIICGFVGQKTWRSRVGGSYGCSRTLGSIAGNLLNSIYAAGRRGGCLTVNVKKLRAFVFGGKSDRSKQLAQGRYGYSRSKYCR